MFRKIYLMLWLTLVATGCGGGGGGSCPDVQEGVDVGWPTIDQVINCEGCTGDETASETFSCPETGDSITVDCADGQIAGSFASTSDCTEGGISCFNGAINTSCLDTVSE